jgi:hypothetical protein
MELNESLKSFAGIFGREGNDIGKVSYSDTAVTAGDPLDQLYALLQFEKLITVGGEFFINIPPAEKRSMQQQGWYLVRKKGSDEWITDDTHWSRDWLVFAGRNDDAIYFNKSDGKVYGSVDKKLRFQLGNSLAEFFSLLSAAMQMESERYSFNTRNEDEEVLPDFLSDLQELLEANTDTKTATEFIAFFFG